MGPEYTHYSTRGFLVRFLYQTRICRDSRMGPAYTRPIVVVLSHCSSFPAHNSTVVSVVFPSFGCPILLLGSCSIKSVSPNRNCSDTFQSGVIHLDFVLGFLRPHGFRSGAQGYLERR